VSSELTYITRRFVAQERGPTRFFVAPGLFERPEQQDLDQRPVLLASLPRRATGQGLLRRLSRGDRRPRPAELGGQPAGRHRALPGRPSACAAEV